MGKYVFNGLRPAEEAPQPTVFLTGRNLASWWDKHPPKPEEAKDSSEETGEKRQEEQPLDK